MARIKSTVFDAIEYPTLRPWDFLDLAIAHGLTQEQAKQLSGFNPCTWNVWLYSKTRTPKNIQREKLEKLYRIAVDMGWEISRREAIAA